MHLKKLIISGFKSFADKVSLHFEDGITGIVGPNGSGKSNVIDAVRWVMGEQNAKHLRGKVATDIIFAGSDKRKQLGMAEVTLVFDNSDYSSFCPAEYRHETEIALTRRLYIDGQREYLINKKPCRLKDIVGFFSTTGLGGRTYSMIQQGQVDRILNAKPEDVREILEEAAGTAIFKLRKQTAEKKLVTTSENLLRIDDIVIELARQLESLKTQVEKAKKWRELSTEMRDKELSLLAHNYSYLSEQYGEVQKLIASDTDDEVEFITQLAALEARHSELQKILLASDPQLDSLREEVSNSREEIARAEATIKSAILTIENGEKRLLNLDQEVAEESASLEAMESQLEAANEEYLSAHNMSLQLNEYLESFQDEVEEAEEARRVFEGKISDQEDEIKNIDRLLDSNALRCEAMERDRKRELKGAESFIARIQSLEDELKAIEDVVAQNKEKVSQKQGGLEAQILGKQVREQAVLKRSEEIHALSDLRDETKERYMAIRARHTSLQELEAISGDVGAAMAQLRNVEADADKYVQGMLTDYISFDNSVSEISPTAVSAFEIWAEQLVVNSLEDFNQLVRLANKHSIGGIPVALLAGNSGIDEEKISRWAEEYDAESLTRYITVTKHHPELAGLLRRIYLLPTLGLSDDELQAVPKDVIAFTARGVIITDRNRLIIGTKGAKGILSRRTEVEELAGQLKSCERELAKSQGELDGLETLQCEDRLVIREIDEKLRSQNSDVLEVMASLQSSTQHQDHKRELLEEAARQYASSEELVHAFLKELAELGEARISLGRERSELAADLDALKDDALSLQDRHEEIMRQFQQKKIDLAKAESKSHALLTNHRHLGQQLERMQTALKRRYEERSRIEYEMEQSRVSEGQSRREIEALVLRREELEKMLADRREENADLNEEIRNIEVSLRGLREKQNEFERSRSKKSVELERTKIGIDMALANAMEKYQIDLLTYEFEVDQDFDKEKIAKDVQRLRGRIDNIGGVNMMAIDEYDQILQRYDFIQAQREELAGSIALLEDVISEIEETAKERFLSVFAVINSNFQELFPILFPGGDAQLQLTNEIDPLNGGVDILVRLPGKKQQSMSLFSGGEKALTAISLIFALLKTKPTPFCFLDEVDAPLDEANVGRYNRVLEKLSERFQFIIITHNRRTMEVLDQLYGVTMQEGGVSKVVGVDMKKDIPPHLSKAFKETESRSLAGATAG